MPRPRMHRRICCCQKINYYKPAGVPSNELEEITIMSDEIEAIRLCDAEKLEQDEAAKKMNVSQPTFSRILGSARHKIAKAIIEGKAIKIEK
ncbi:MAG: DUF134 domain-containing protein [Candidatus Nanoarchaeia archaeon]|nr:DUF134 domain-containing protein [Candidatus Nanoarchaeia archaeon]